MKIKITFGIGNGQKDSKVIETNELPKRYDLLHGQAAMSAEIVKDEKPATGAGEQPPAPGKDNLDF